MNAGIERRATSLGVVAAVIIMGVIVVVGVILAQPELETSGIPLADEDEPLPGGTRTTIADASSVFPVPIYRPAALIASDATISETWVRLGSSPEVWIQYRSGIVVLVRPLGDLQQTQDFAEAQVKDGVPGRIQTIEGIEAFVVPQTEDGSGSVRLVLDGVLITIVGYVGDFSEEQLTVVAASVVKTSAGVAALRAPD